MLRTLTFLSVVTLSFTAVEEKYVWPGQPDHALLGVHPPGFREDFFKNSPGSAGAEADRSGPHRLDSSAPIVDDETSKQKTDTEELEDAYAEFNNCTDETIDYKENGTDKFPIVTLARAREMRDFMEKCHYKLRTFDSHLDKFFNKSKTDPESVSKEDLDYWNGVVDEIQPMVIKMRADIETLEKFMSSGGNIKHLGHTTTKAPRVSHYKKPTTPSSSEETTTEGYVEPTTKSVFFGSPWYAYRVGEGNFRKNHRGKKKGLSERKGKIRTQHGPPQIIPVWPGQPDVDGVHPPGFEDKLEKTVVIQVPPSGSAPPPANPNAPHDFMKASPDGPAPPDQSYDDITSEASQSGSQGGFNSHNARNNMNAQGSQQNSQNMNGQGAPQNFRAEQNVKNGQRSHQNFQSEQNNQGAVLNAQNYRTSQGSRLSQNAQNSQDSQTSRNSQNLHNSQEANGAGTVPLSLSPPRPASSFRSSQEGPSPPEEVTYDDVQMEKTKTLLRQRPEEPEPYRKKKSSFS